MVGVCSTNGVDKKFIQNLVVQPQGRDNFGDQKSDDTYIQLRKTERVMVWTGLNWLNIPGGQEKA